MHEKTVADLAEEYRRIAATMSFYDASLWLGRPEGFPLAEEMDVAQLTQVLDAHRISGGLISHWRGKSVSPQEGNAALETAMPRSSERLFAVMTCLPLYPTQPGPLPGLGAPPQNLRGVRLFPRSHGFSLEDYVIGSLCEWTIEHRLPLMMWHSEIPWRQFHRLTGQYPHVLFVIESAPVPIGANLRAVATVMRDYPNIMLEISNVTGPFLEYAHNRFGPQRLLFGSFLPVNDPRVPQGMLFDADIPEVDRHLIAGDNLWRICREVQL